MKGWTNINIKNREGETPLHEAVKGNNKDLIEWLITHGADVNARDLSGCTPVSTASGYGHKDIVELLKAAGGVEGD